MYHMSWLINIKLLITIISLDGTVCTIDGSVSYHRHNVSKHGNDPCNPLYWYPKQIPEYCYYRRDGSNKPPESKYPEIIPMPIPVPLPPVPPPILPPIMPQPIMSLPYPLPFGIPLVPTHPMLPIAAAPFQHLPLYLPAPVLPAPAPPPPVAAPVSPLFPPPPLVSPFASYVPPYGIQRRPMSMVPGLPGLVSPDGGINVLPFSDAYANLLERHKQKMIRKRLKKLLDAYDRYPWKNSNEDTRRMNTVPGASNNTDNIDYDFVQNKDQGSDQVNMEDIMFK